MTRLLLFFLAWLSLPFASEASVIKPDPKIVSGQLKNGLTYIVVPSHNTSYYVHAFLCNNIGSAVELEDEQGMAHFIEHCVFDGTKNFPGNSLREELAKSGIDFGSGLNASTGQDFTTFKVTGINGLNPDCVRVALLALHDMGSCALIADETVEKERKIILEEWRQGNGARERISQLMRNHLFGSDSPYAHPVIGSPELISDFTPQSLRDFYQRWYTPDNQAIVVVGNFKPKDIVKLIKEIWSDIPANDAPVERQWTQLPDLGELRTAVILDSEFPGCQMDMWFPSKPFPRDRRNTTEYFNKQLTAYIASKILKERLVDILYSSNSPWTAAQAEWTDFYGADCRDALRLYVLYDRNRRCQALQTLVAEVRQAVEIGITQPELDYAVTNLRAIAGNAVKDYEEIKSGTLANRLIRQFNTRNVAYDGNTEKLLYDHFCDTISLAAVNSFLSDIASLDNLAISLTESQVDDADYPSNEDFKAQVQYLWRRPLCSVGYDNNRGAKILSVNPIPGKILSTEEDSEFNARIYRLSNGSRCVAAFCDNELDRLTVRAVHRGGESATIALGYIEAYYGPELFELGGMGDFSALDLRRMLAPTKIELGLRHHPYSEILEGECRVDELEKLLQLMHLRLTTVRQDTALFHSWLTRQKGLINDWQRDPGHVFADSLRCALYGPGNNYMRLPTVADLDTLDYQQALEIMRSRMSQPEQWDFVISGNIDFNLVEPLIEKYFASLHQASEPSHKPTGHTEFPSPINSPRRAREGCYEVRFMKPMEKPFTRVYHAYELHQDYTIADEMAMQILAEILNHTLIEKIREEEGAAYSPFVGAVSSEVDGLHSLYVSIDTNEEMAEAISSSIRDAIKDISDKGLNPELYQQVYQGMCEEESRARYYQSFPMTFYTHYLLYGDRHPAQRAEALRSITLERLQQLATQLLSAPAQYTLIMTGEKSTAD